MGHNVKEGLFELGSGALNFGKKMLDPRVPVIGSSKFPSKISPTRKLDPNSMAGAVLGGLPEEQKKAEDLWAKGGVGNRVDALGHGLASYIPMIGPWAAGLGEQGGTGDIGGALSKGGTQVLAMKAAPKIAGKAFEKVTEPVRIYRGLRNISEGKFPANTPDYLLCSSEHRSRCWEQSRRSGVGRFPQ